MKTRKVHHAVEFDKGIPVIGFGAMGISDFYGNTDEQEAGEAIKMALENGVNHFDTADAYGFGKNEAFLGKALNLSSSAARKTVILASKAGIVRSKDDLDFRDVCIKPEYLKQQLEQSLKNLGTSYLDIFYVHRLPPAASGEELEDLAYFLLSLKKQGYVRAVGLSEPKFDQLKKVHAICPLSFLQSEYNLLERGIEKTGILSFCHAENILFVAYSPLCRGLLTDQFQVGALEADDFRVSLPKFSGDNYHHNLGVIEKLKDLSSRLGVSLASLSLAWLRAQKTIVIPGMRKTSRVLDALSSLRLELTSKDFAEIERAAYVGAALGSRYGDAWMQSQSDKMSLGTKK